MLIVYKGVDTSGAGPVPLKANPKSHRHGSDGAFGEEPLVLLELSVALVSGAAVALVLVRAVLVGG